jgi:hypothetical protein
MELDGVSLYQGRGKVGAGVDEVKLWGACGALFIGRSSEMRGQGGSWVDSGGVLMEIDYMR